MRLKTTEKKAGRLIYGNILATEISKASINEVIGIK